MADYSLMLPGYTHVCVDKAVVSSARLSIALLSGEGAVVDIILTDRDNTDVLIDFTKAFDKDKLKQ